MQVCGDYCFNVKINKTNVRVADEKIITHNQSEILIHLFIKIKIHMMGRLKEIELTIFY